MVLSEREIRQIMVKSTLTSDEVGKIRLDLDSEIVIVSKNLAQKLSVFARVAFA